MSSLCWFDVTIGGVKQKERIVLRLFDDKTPKTCANFRALCEGNGGNKVEGTDIPMTYKGCSFHRIIKNFMIQGGDFTNHNGTGGVSIYGEKFEDENFEMPCDRAGLLAMANAGPNTNGSQFFITTVPCHHLTGKHVVFGKVIRGMSVVRTLEHTATGAQDVPVSPCIIEDCGTVAETDLPPLPVPADGDTYSDYPIDHEPALDDAGKMAAGEALRAIGNKYFGSGDFQAAVDKYNKALRYLGEVIDTSALHSALRDAKVACNNNSAMCLIKQKNWAAARAAACAALQEDPANTKALYRRALAAMEIKDYDEAKGDLEQLLKIEPGNADATTRLAEVKQRAEAQKKRMAAGFKKMFS